MRIKAEDKQALLEESDVEKRLRQLIGILTRELDVLELGSKIQSDVRSEIDKGQREYFLRQQMRAIQQELGETDEQEAEIDELREKVDELKLPEEADKAARRELDRLANISPQSAEYPVIRTYLDWIITLPWKVQQRGQPRRGARARDPRRGPLRPREGQGPHPRVPGGAQAEGRPAGADPVLRRPARRRQDQPRPQHRRGHGPQVRAHQRRRRARRGRDPRPSPHLRRRDARHHHPRHARRRHQQPGVHDRRDRQDGRRLARRPLERPARGARPGAEHHLPRPLPRPAVRPQQGAVHHHGQPARAHPRPAARPHGGHQPRRLHRSRRSCRSPGSTWCRGSSRPTASSRGR